MVMRKDMHKCKPQRVKLYSEKLGVRQGPTLGQKYTVPRWQGPLDSTREPQFTKVHCRNTTAATLLNLS
jgi:hypothetical protein